MKKRKDLRHLLILFISLALFSCTSQSNAPYDSNDSVPKGDPAFPQLTNSWVIDKAGVLSPGAEKDGDSICQRLQDDGIAEVVVLVINGVKHPEDYATHYGRWLKLGKTGMSTEGGNNGVVWLIRPDAKERMTISVGRGLPKFTSADYFQIMEAAADYINFNNFDKGVLVIIQETDRRLRELQKK